MMSQRRYHRRADRCSCCGWRFGFTFPMLWDQLKTDWDLSDDLQRQLDQRESATCQRCHSIARTRGIGAILLESINRRCGLDIKTVVELAHYAGRIEVSFRIAEINALPGLHAQFSKMRCVSCSEYGSAVSEDLMALSYADETFDYVLTSDTLEHVPDFDKALQEIRRVLKPGGAHIFTIPVIWERETRQRASVEDGEVVYLLPPSYHGSPDTDAGDLLVFNEFGGDVVERIEAAGFRVALHRFDHNPLHVVLAAEKSETLDV
jgi:SAM-dependent methyltransferase